MTGVQWWMFLVAAVGGGLVGGAAAAWVLSARGHQHNHVAVAVSPVDGMAGLSHPATDLLARCECGDVRSVTLAGRWALDQVQGLALGDALAPGEETAGELAT